MNAQSDLNFHIPVTAIRKYIVSNYFHFYDELHIYYVTNVNSLQSCWL